MNAKISDTPQLQRPLIKVCGITNEADAMYAAQAGADYLGFILNYPVSPRYVTLVEVRPLIQRVRQLFPHVQIVGVFVDASADTVCTIAQNLQLNVVQLHGEEPISEVQIIHTVGRDSGFKVFKTVELHHVRDLELIQEYETVADLILLDAGKGSGKQIQTHLLQQAHSSVPIGIAGGLKPHNVVDIIQRHQPALVDVNSGVESVPGKKDRSSLKTFISHVRQTDNTSVVVERDAPTLI